MHDATYILKLMEEVIAELYPVAEGEKTVDVAFGRGALGGLRT